ncbi:MAG: epoxide hydrolase family protein [Pseudomonadota bacterium]
MSQPAPFTIDTPEDTLARIRERVAAYRWFPAPSDDDWRYGMATDVLREVVDYWQSGYDWRAAEAELNKFPQYKAVVDGIEVHFVHVVGEAGGARPLLITHGWPGSVYEFWDAIEPLAFPSRHGGDAKDAFDLVIPSLPGYGWSGKPAKPFGQRATAKLWDTLMTETLGYETYLAQGGDWGGLVTSWLGYKHGPGSGGCKAIHLNMIGLRPTPAAAQTKDEEAWLARAQGAMQLEGAYFMEQATKPQTLALGLMDSPVGQAAWIMEKFHGWSDLKDGDLWSVYTKDQLLTNVMIYLVNDAFATSVWYYNALFQEGGANLPEGERCETPTGFANFPGEALYTAPPRSWCDRAYNIVHWSDMTEGGHFAAMETPGAFVEDVRAWARLFD